MSLAHRFLSRRLAEGKSLDVKRVAFLLFFLVVGMVAGYGAYRYSRVILGGGPTVLKRPLKRAPLKPKMAGVTPGASANRTLANKTLASANSTLKVVPAKKRPRPRVEAKPRVERFKVVRRKKRTPLYSNHMVVKRLKALSDVERATRAFRAGDYGRAAALYEKVLRREPHNRKALLNLGIIYHRIGRDDAARKLFERILSFNPNDVDAMNNLAVLYMSGGDYQKALDMLDKVLKIDPVNRAALLNKGLCLRWLGDIRGALRVFYRGMELYPKEYRFYLYAGTILYDEGNTQQAYSFLSKAYSLIEDKDSEVARILRRVLER